MTESLAELQKLYGNYLEKTAQLEENKKLGEGIFGSAGPKTDPCHQLFADGVKACLDAAAESGIPSAEVRVILEYLFQMPMEHGENQLAYWMLLAVQGLALGLAGTLEPVDAAELLARFRTAYPKNQWLPVQKKLALVLEKRSRG